MQKRSIVAGSLLAFIMTLALIPILTPQALAATSIQLRDQINSIPGLTATEAMGVVTVTGNAINDCGNNTQISVRNGGALKSGSAGPIRTTGAETVTTAGG